MRNSINEMINVLRSKPFLTENELTWAAFNYDRALAVVRPGLASNASSAFLNRFT